jgi:hypothetical protein
MAEEYLKNINLATANFDYYCDWVPVASIVNNTVDIVVKSALDLAKVAFNDSKILQNKAFVHLDEKSYTECFLKLIPGVNIIASQVFKREKEMWRKLEIDAAKDGEAVSEYIKDNGIKNQTILGGIAKIAAAENGWAVSRYIENYGITDQTILGEIAKIAVAQDTGVVSQHIKRYRIKDQKVLGEIAKIIAAKNGQEVSAYIQGYGITDQIILGEIAKIAAAENGWAVSQYIENYGITDQKVLGEIAKIAVAQDTGAVSRYIENYGITDQKVLGEIAKIAAAKNGREVSEYIQKYGITDQKVLGEIAKIAAAQDGWSVSRYIQNYGIENHGTRLSIFMVAYIADKDSLKRIKEYNLGIYEELFLSKSADISSICKKLFLDRDENFKDFLKLTDSLMNQIEEIKDEWLKNERYNLLKCTISRYSMRDKKLNPDVLKAFEHIFNYQDPKMRYELITCITKMDDKQEDAYKKIINNKEQDFIVLPAILLSKLVKNHEKWNDLLPKMQDRIFRDSANLRPLLNTIDMLSKSLELTEEDIISLLETSIDLTDKDRTRSNLLSIQTVIALGGSKELKKESFEKNNRDFSKSYQNAFSKHIPIKEVKDFSEKFSNTFETYRSNNSLMVYAGTLTKHSESKKALQTLAIYVENVLNGCFEKERYSGSDHLNTVFEKREDLKQAWMDGAKESFNIGSNESSDKEKVENKSFEIFTNAIIKDKHLDTSKYSYLQKYLTGSDEDKSILENQLGDDIKEKQKKTETMQQDFKNKKIKIEELKKQANLQKPLQLQQAIISFLKVQTSGEQLTTLRKIQKILKEIDKTCEFNHDIDGLIKSIEGKIDIPSKQWTIEDTDDPWDLLLCGTEVAGSCQKIDGEVQHNIGLLGYLLDGKNRLIAIKDSTGKIIGRRLLRILWDANSKKPVLMVELTYPDKLPSQYKETLDRFVKQRAKDLGLPLYEEGSESNVKLESKGSKVDWEYVDSAGGIKPKGVYTINKAKLVQSA